MPFDAFFPFHRHHHVPSTCYSCSCCVSIYLYCLQTKIRRQACVYRLLSSFVNSLKCHTIIRFIQITLDILASWKPKWNWRPTKHWSMSSATNWSRYFCARYLCQNADHPARWCHRANIYVKVSISIFVMDKQCITLWSFRFYFFSLLLTCHRNHATMQILSGRF